MVKRVRKVKGKKYNFGRELKKILKNPYKRQNAGVLALVKNNEIQHPLRIVDINECPIELGDLKIHTEHFRKTKLKYSSLPMVLINDNDVMTSAGIYYVQNMKGTSETDPPKEIIIDSYTYKDEKGNTQTIKENMPLVKALQPSNKLNGSTLMGMFYGMTATDNWKKFLKDNKNLIYAGVGVAVGVAVILYFVYQMYNVEIPAIKSGIGACRELANILKDNVNITKLG